MIIIFPIQYGLVRWNDSQVFIYIIIAFVYTIASSYHNTI